ncbi:fructosamine-3-kinase-like isoform X1 [Schistocerca nitens]|uniref:fructosamine-3-kinase-like isoform X1 n=1 Tax=Schistocerca nitens TaxID=7011 RepID=UPI00211885F9|nr:fructosamine-3-kinase-like isoform X1 [Schistocerca nitens]
MPEPTWVFSTLHGDMEAIIKDALNTVTFKAAGKGGGGCINEGEAYFTDTGTVFVKQNRKSQARLMFDGELESLKTIAATNTVRVPQPIVVLDNPRGGSVLVLEYVDMKTLSKFSKQLGQQLARLHLHNSELKTKASQGFVGQEENVSYVEKFGFHVTTCCGYIPLENEWCSDWPTFFARNRLDHQVRLVEKNCGDPEVRELWSELQLKIPKFFEGLDIQPALLHGDLWGGNIAETATGPVIFDPASFYGHHEFELGIARMFGGFSQAFYDAYFDVIPKAPGFETRNKLYLLFNYLNHWNHFGAGYRNQSLSIMKALLK